LVVVLLSNSISSPCSLETDTTTGHINSGHHQILLVELAQRITRKLDVYFSIVRRRADWASRDMPFVLLSNSISSPCSLETDTTTGHINSGHHQRSGRQNAAFRTCSSDGAPTRSNKHRDRIGPMILLVELAPTSKIIGPIRSRCLLLRVGAPSEEQVRKAAFVFFFHHRVDLCGARTPV
jgi:hypothetical protein